MDEFVFYMDVSPKWWIKARNNSSYLESYVCDKFELDFYPRIITIRRNEIDLDKPNNKIKQEIIKKLEKNEYDYEFFPEDEKLKESYSISNGFIHFHPRKRKTNSRLLIRIKDLSFENFAI